MQLSRCLLICLSTTLSIWQQRYSPLKPCFLPHLPEPLSLTAKSTASPTVFTSTINQLTQQFGRSLFTSQPNFSHSSTSWFLWDYSFCASSYTYCFEPSSTIKNVAQALFSYLILCHLYIQLSVHSPVLMLQGCGFKRSVRSFSSIVYDPLDSSSDLQSLARPPFKSRRFSYHFNHITNRYSCANTLRFQCLWDL